MLPLVSMTLTDFQQLLDECNSECLLLYLIPLKLVENNIQVDHTHSNKMQEKFLVPFGHLSFQGIVRTQLIVFIDSYFVGIVVQDDIRLLMLFIWGKSMRGR